MKQERVFKNTFAPACENHELSVSDIIAGLGFGAFKYRALPPEVRKAVGEEMKRRTKAREARPRAGEAKRRAEMLDAARELVQRRAGGTPDVVRAKKGEGDAVAERERAGASGAGVPMAHVGKRGP